MTPSKKICSDSKNSSRRSTQTSTKTDFDTLVQQYDNILTTFFDEISRGRNHKYVAEQFYHLLERQSCLRRSYQNLLGFPLQQIRLQRLQLKFFFFINFKFFVSLTLRHNNNKIFILNMLMQHLKHLLPLLFGITTIPYTRFSSHLQQHLMQTYP